MATPVPDFPVQAGSTSPQIDTCSRRTSSSTDLLPTFDFEAKASSELATPDHAKGTVSTNPPSTNVAASLKESPSDVPEEAPKSWKWALNKLTKLVNEAKGAATDEVIKFVKRHLSGTKLIFVVGKTGTGKTTILSELTGLPGMETGETLKSGTREYHVCPAIVDDEQYLFIDTAGFGDRDHDDVETFRNTVSCLISFGSFVQVVGVLYVIGNPGTRLEQQDAKTLRWLQCFCGPAFFRNVTFVTSFWDTYNEAAFKQAHDRMQSLYADNIVNQAINPASPEKRYHGAHFYHHGVTGGKLTLDSFPGLPLCEKTAERREELRNLIRLRYAELKYKPVKLQFMNEVENKVPFLDTEAAKVLRAPAVGVAVKIVDGKCIIVPAKESPETPPLHFDEVPEAKPTSWRETILKWNEIVFRVAKYYREARRRNDPLPTTVKGVWGTIRDWWFGSSEAT
ncbi:hypothetical protein NM208_g364 [Fusarium decemcellulare]|uniref:Uncharacterized protein n=1 Tax=Fusarium decemcellulare TaxID=57161 RepID=A0ACC1SZK3_9HYPO|nr:hypothetical protein NM208_g364 [Fusarium decemcellulare]